MAGLDPYQFLYGLVVFVSVSQSEVFLCRVDHRWVGWVYVHPDGKLQFGWQHPNEQHGYGKGVLFNESSDEHRKSVRLDDSSW